MRGLSAKAVVGSAHTIHFVIDGRMYTIGLDPEGSAPPLQETDLPRSVVDAFEDCRDDLAGC